MKIEQLKRIFDFLEENEEQNPPFMWKYMNNIPLTEDDLNIEGDLDLSGIEATSIPEGLKIKGNLNLQFSKITSLPRDLNIKGNLNLVGTKIKSLPEGLEVGGNLNLKYTKITSVPKGLQVGGDLFIRASVFAIDLDDDELREMVKPGFIKGRIVR